MATPFVFVGRGANNGTRGQVAAEENRGLRHDQICLKVFPSERRCVEVGKHQRGICWIGQRGRIAGFVLPSLKVHCFGGPDAKHDSQYFHTGDSLSQGWVEAGAALLDGAKVETGGVGDGLNVVAGAEVSITSRDRRMLADS